MVKLKQKEEDCLALSEEKGRLEEQLMELSIGQEQLKLAVSEYRQREEEMARRVGVERDTQTQEVSWDNRGVQTKGVKHKNRGLQT